MTDYMKEAKRLAVHLTHAAGAGDRDAEASFRAALLAHIQRGAVPEGWKEATIAWEVCASIHREYAKKKDPFFTTRQADFVRRTEAARAALLATTPDNFRDAAKMVAEPAEVPMPDVFMYGIKEPDGGAWMQEVCVSTLKGDVDELVDDLNEGRDDADTRYTTVSLVTTEDAKRYGAACRAAGEAAGYAQGLRDAGRDAGLDAERYRTVRFLATAECDPLPDYEGDTSSPDAFDASIDHATAALRGKVK